MLENNSFIAGNNFRHVSWEAVSDSHRYHLLNKNLTPYFLAKYSKEDCSGLGMTIGQNPTSNLEFIRPTFRPSSTSSSIS